MEVFKLGMMLRSQHKIRDLTPERCVHKDKKCKQILLLIYSSNLVVKSGLYSHSTCNHCVFSQ